MILSVRTDAPDVELALLNGDTEFTEDWHADRKLARDLLGKIEKLLEENRVQWSDLQGIIVYQGPGSFTGLRIGCTVANTIAYSLSLPIVGTTASDWKQQGLSRLRNNENDQLVVPVYGGDPHITQPKR